MVLNLFNALLNSSPFASTPAGLRTCVGALFASFKKYAAHFLNPDFVGTEPNNAPYTGTGKLCSI